MTRGRPSPPESDLHARFTAWLQSGADGDPPRDAAVHAAHCVRCRAATTALDHLAVIDVGRAPLPPSRGAARARTEVLARPRTAAAVASGLVVLAAATWIGIGALAPGLIGSGQAASSAEQDVLGGFGAGGAATPDPAPAVSFGGVTLESNAPTPGHSAATAEPAPDTPQPFVPTPAPTAVQPPSSSPPPSVGASKEPSASPSGTATPSPSPAVSPSLPTPQPTPMSEKPSASAGDGGG